MQRAPRRAPQCCQAQQQQTVRLAWCGRCCCRMALQRCSRQRPPALCSPPAAPGCRARGLPSPNQHLLQRRLDLTSSSLKACPVHHLCHRRHQRGQRQPHKLSPIAVSALICCRRWLAMMTRCSSVLRCMPETWWQSGLMGWRSAGAPAASGAKSFRQEEAEKETKKLLDEEEERRKTRRRKKVFVYPCLLSARTSGGQ